MTRLTLGLPNPRQRNIVLPVSVREFGNTRGIDLDTFAYTGIEIHKVTGFDAFETPAGNMIVARYCHIVVLVARLTKR